MVSARAEDAFGEITRRGFRHARVDVALCVLALLVGTLSLVFPFGHDQAVHYYVGREWVQHGAIPYRDTFDYKTPGIFVVHALLVAIFGEHTWPIRAADLACVLALGLLTAKLVDTRARGMVGFVCFATAVVYYGYFSFWDTAQCELWAVTFAIGSIVATRSSASAAGALAGLAFVMKPPAVLIALPALVTCVRESPRRAAFFVASAAAPVVTTLGYFQLHGAMPALRDVLLGADAQYVIGTRRVSTPGETFEQLVDVVSWFQPFGALLVGGVIVLLVMRRAQSLPRMPLVLAALALAAVAVQLKFYRYHYALLVPAIVLALANVALAVPHMSAVRASAAIVALYALAGSASRNWLADQRAALAYVTGSIDRTGFASRFSIGWLAYSERDTEDAGAWIRARTSENEAIGVRGFQPGVYVFARRRAPGRFFWTTPLTDPKRTYRREEWLAEDARDVATLTPFVMTPNDAQGPDAPDRFIKLGYTRCRTFGRLAILGRDGACHR